MWRWTTSRTKTDGEFLKFNKCLSWKLYFFPQHTQHLQTNADSWLLSNETVATHYRDKWRLSRSLEHSGKSFLQIKRRRRSSCCFPLPKVAVNLSFAPHCAWPQPASCVSTLLTLPWIQGPTTHGYAHTAADHKVAILPCPRWLPCQFDPHRQGREVVLQQINQQSDKYDLSDLSD